MENTSNKKTKKAPIVPLDTAGVADILEDAVLNASLLPRNKKTRYKALAGWKGQWIDVVGLEGTYNTVAEAEKAIAGINSPVAEYYVIVPIIPNEHHV
jgi:hypothetical protein